jgi:hypothetical protein
MTKESRPTFSNITGPRHVNGRHQLRARVRQLGAYVQKGLRRRRLHYNEVKSDSVSSDHSFWRRIACRR